MSVLIKGIEMPRNCWECPCSDKSNGVCEAIVGGATIWDDRPAWCPLVNVPPHGRLIAADAFSAKIIEIVERQKYDDFYDQRLSVGAILREVANELKGAGLDGYANSPTIIPAEEGE